MMSRLSVSELALAFWALQLTPRSASSDTVVCSPKLLQLLETGPGEMASALKVPLEGIHPFRGQVVHYHPPRFDDWVQAYCGTCEEKYARLRLVSPGWWR